MKKIIVALILCCMNIVIYGQETESNSEDKSFWSHFYLPWIDAGYMLVNSDVLENGFIAKSGLEYRVKNMNSFFFRFNYDTYNANYTLPKSNDMTNAIKGTAQIQEVFLAPGYRFGNEYFQLALTYMPGIRFYDVPNAILENDEILIYQESKSLFITSAVLSGEYYFSERPGISLSLFQNQTWNKVDFWENGRVAIGLSIGYFSSF